MMSFTPFWLRVSEGDVAQDRRFPNRWSRYVLLGVRKAVGGERFRPLMSVARLTRFLDDMPSDDFVEEGLSLQEVGRLFEALEEINGTRLGRDLARQAGRESFQLWRNGFGSVSGLMDSVVPLLPTVFRMRVGLEIVAEIFARYLGQRVTLDEDVDRFSVALSGCGFCSGRWTQEPVCWFMVGFLEGLTDWLTGGDGCEVREVLCMAKGDPVCVFAVEKPVRSTRRA